MNDDCELCCSRPAEAVFGGGVLLCRECAAVVQAFENDEHL